MTYIDKYMAAGPWKPLPTSLIASTPLCPHLGQLPGHHYVDFFRVSPPVYLSLNDMLSFVCLGISYPWNHVIYIFLGLSSFILLFVCLPFNHHF